MEQNTGFPVHSVTAENIHQITAADTGAPTLPVPTLEEKIASLEPPEQEKMRAALARIPAAMELVPVVYKKIAAADNRKTLEEFMSAVAPLFYKHLGAAYAPQLRDSGFAPEVIEALRQGRYDENSCDYNLDHVIERSGGGALSLVKSPDPDLPPDDEAPAETYGVNHFRNFYFLPKAVHEIKNEINALQLANITEGETRVIYMLVPRPGPDFIPFFKADGRYGPVSHEHADYTYDAMAATARAQRLLALFEQTPEGGLLRDLGASVKTGAAAEAGQRETLRQSVRGILGGEDTLAAGRHKKVCLAFEHAMANAEKVIAGWEDAPTRKAGQRLKFRDENFAPFKQAFQNLVLEDGQPASVRLQAAETRMDAALGAMPKNPVPPRRQMG